MYDLVIRGGTIVDGRGGAPFKADVGITGEKIVFVGPDAKPGNNEVDATGRIVTPGFVDIHTHYDAQAIWDPVLAPSSYHGVTSVVMGNCGVGFAPVKPEHRSWMIEIMENVEEIPRKVLETGLKTWNWETFPEYLSALEAVPRTIDVGAQIPHIAVRGYVMGDRAKRDEPSTDDDNTKMAKLVEEGLRAGAVGFSCSRTNVHRTSTGERIPGSLGGREELLAIADGIKRAGRGPVQVLADLDPGEEEFPWLEQMSIRSNALVGFVLIQGPLSDKDWRWQVERLEKKTGGSQLLGHISPRGNGAVLHWRASIHPFVARPSWKKIAHLPWQEQFAKLKDPAFKKQLLSEENDAFGRSSAKLRNRMLNGFAGQYEMTDSPDYEPDAETQSLAVCAAKVGMEPQEYAYEVLMKDEGAGMIYIPLVNYDAGNLDHVRELMHHPQTVVSLSDGGAHVTRVIDASAPTFLLTHWARDRKRGQTIPLEMAVKSYTSDPAKAYGFMDRGVIATGYLADVNVIDFEKLKLLRPYVVEDLPAGGRRILQRAEGYDATVKRGQIIFRHGEPTGLLPGRVIRGPQPAPAA